MRCLAIRARLHARHVDTGARVKGLSHRATDDRSIAMIEVQAHDTHADRFPLVHAAAKWAHGTRLLSTGAGRRSDVTDWGVNLPAQLILTAAPHRYALKMRLEYTARATLARPDLPRCHGQLRRAGFAMNDPAQICHEMWLKSTKATFAIIQLEHMTVRIL